MLVPSCSYFVAGKWWNTLKFLLYDRCASHPNGLISSWRSTQEEIVLILQSTLHCQKVRCFIIPRKGNDQKMIARRCKTQPCTSSLIERERQ
ncbi:hypothetical protein ACET3Z_026695 [Daucus carota]